MARGETHPSAKLTAASVIAMRRAYAAGTTTITRLALEHGVTTSVISEAIAGKTWKHL